MAAVDKINAFYNTALCKLACEFDYLTARQNKGIRIDEEKMEELQLVEAMLEVIQGYDPSVHGNCMFCSDILNIIEFVATKLDICNTGIDPTICKGALDGINYMNVELGDNIHIVG